MRAKARDERVAVLAGHADVVDDHPMQPCERRQRAGRGPLRGAGAKRALRADILRWWVGSASSGIVTVNAVPLPTDVVEAVDPYLRARLG